MPAILQGRKAEAPTACSLYAGVLHKIMRLLQLLRRLSLPAALVLAAAARAQGPIDHPPVDPRNIVTASLSRPLDITSAWLFHEGDDPAFASPTLDDSRWRPVLSEKPLAAQGITYPKFVWYRTHVHVPPHQHSIAILLRRFRGSEQVFVNGVLTGPSSDFPPGGRSTDTVDMIAPLPDYLIDGGDLVIAIRADIEFAARSIPANPGFDLFTAIWVGDTTVLSSLSSLYNFRALSSNVTNDALTFLVLLIALALAFSLRDEREYPALCLFLAGSGVSEAIAIWRSLHATVYNRWSDIPGQMLLLASIVAGVEFARMVLRLPRSRWIVVYEWLIVACISAGSILSFSFYDAGIPPRPVLYFILASVASLLAPLYLGLPIFALWVWRRNRNLDALLLSVPLLIKSMFFYVQIGVIVLHLAHLTKREYLQPAATTMFYFRWDDVAEFFFLLALLGFLILRTVRLARARAALAAEFAAAENVQQLLLARASQPTPGFSVETAYPPCQRSRRRLLPRLSRLRTTRLTAIVGDVSGKGLTAAMRVAMILGVLRRETSRYARHHPRPT